METRLVAHMSQYRLASPAQQPPLLPIEVRYAPFDAPCCVDRFLDEWSPDAAIWIESELWPVLISQTAARGVPMLLANGKMSDRSFRRWQSWGPLRDLVAQMLCRFDSILAQVRIHSLDTRE
jgi:3-deoxy-D-manno-octulosonic-acid transferase